MLYRQDIKRDAGNDTLITFSKAKSAVFSVCKRLIGIYLSIYLYLAFSDNYIK